MTTLLRCGLTAVAVLATTTGTSLAGSDIASASQHGHHGKPAHHGKKHHHKKAKNEPEKPLRNNKVVFFTSIGGIYLGETYAKAKRGFDGTECVSGAYGGCVEDLPHGDNVTFDTGSAKKVITVHISATRGKKSPLARVKTSKGIHIGSSYAAAHKAYPNGTLLTTVPGSGGYYLEQPSTGRFTQFDLEHNKVVGIEVYVPDSY